MDKDFGTNLDSELSGMPDPVPTPQLCVNNTYSHVADADPEQQADCAHIYINEQHCSDAMKKMKTLRDDGGRLCDTILIADNTYFWVHGCVLSASSATAALIHLKAPLVAIHSEDSPDSGYLQGHQIILPCKSQDVCLNFVEYLYSGLISINMENIKDLLLLASTFDLADVKYCCSHHMIQNITESNWFQLLEISKQHHLNEVEEKVKHFCLDNMISLCSSGYIPLLTRDVIADFMVFTPTNHTNPQTECGKLWMLLAWIVGDLEHRLEDYPALAAHLDVKLLSETECNDMDTLKHPRIFNHEVTVNILQQVAKFKQILSSAITDDVKPHFDCEDSDNQNESTLTCGMTPLFARGNDVLDDLSERTGTAGFAAHCEQDLVRENRTPSIERALPQPTDILLGAGDGVADKATQSPQATDVETVEIYDIYSQYNAAGQNSPSQNECGGSDNMAIAVARRSRVIQAPLWLSDYVAHPTGRAGKTTAKGHGDSPQRQHVHEEVSKENLPLPSIDIKTGETKDMASSSLAGYEDGAVKEEEITLETISPDGKRPSKRGRPPYTASLPCSSCDKVFRTPSSLRHHESGHGHVAPLLCEVCGFSTRHPGSMRTHMQIHKGMKFRCEEAGCQYFTAIRSRLEDHMSTHQGLLNYVCRFCGKTFAHRRHMQRHEQSHMTERHRSCPRCHYHSARSDKLKAHIRAKHKDLDLMSLDEKPTITTKSFKQSCAVQQGITLSQGCNSVPIDNTSESTNPPPHLGVVSVINSQATVGDPGGTQNGYTASIAPTPPVVCSEYKTKDVASGPEECVSTGVGKTYHILL